MIDMVVHYKFFVISYIKQCVVPENIYMHIALTHAQGQSILEFLSHRNLRLIENWLGITRAWQGSGLEIANGEGWVFKPGFPDGEKRVVCRLGNNLYQTKSVFMQRYQYQTQVKSPKIYVLSSDKIIVFI